VKLSYIKVTKRVETVALTVQLQTLESHLGSVWSVAFSPDGKQVVSGSRDQTIQLWDAVMGAVFQTLKAHLGSFNSVAFSPDGKQVASGSEDETVRLWDAVTGSGTSDTRGSLKLGLLIGLLSRRQAGGVWV
jgi:WD40 repeat protein